MVNFHHYAIVIKFRGIALAKTVGFNSICASREDR